MFRHLTVAILLCLGCSDGGKTGTTHESLPVYGVSYGDRHTYPLIFKAVMPLIAEPSAVFAFEFSESHMGLVKTLESKLGDYKFVPRTQLQKENGKFIDALSGNAGRVLSVRQFAGKSDRARFHIRCSSGDSSTTFEVILRASIDPSQKDGSESGWITGEPSQL